MSRLAGSLAASGPGRLGCLFRPAGPQSLSAAVQAALLDAAAAVDSNRTDIRLETPDSSIVTP